MLTDALLAETAARGLRPRRGPGWTVPTPFRTTEEELAAYRDEGVLVTDMVAAALFAVAAALGARAGGAVVATRTVDARRAGAHTADPPARGGRVIDLVEAAVRVLQAEGVA